MGDGGGEEVCVVVGRVGDWIGCALWWGACGHRGSLQAQNQPLTCGTFGNLPVPTDWALQVPWFVH